MGGGAEHPNRGEAQAECTRRMQPMHKKPMSMSTHFSRNARHGGGPFTCVNELEACISTESPQKLKAILRTELSFRKHTSHRDYLARSYLYKVNQITETEMKVNLTLLLSNDADIETLPDLPSEDDIVNAFHLQETEKDTGQSTSQRESDNDVDVMVNELCIVIWDDKPGQRNWYVGMCRSKDEETYEIEHMERQAQCPCNARLRL